MTSAGGQVGSEAALTRRYAPSLSHPVSVVRRRDGWQWARVRVRVRIASICTTVSSVFKIGSGGKPKPF